MSAGDCEAAEKAARRVRVELELGGSIYVFSLDEAANVRRRLDREIRRATREQRERDLRGSR